MTYDPWEELHRELDESRQREIRDNVKALNLHERTAEEAKQLAREIVAGRREQ